MGGFIMSTETTVMEICGHNSDDTLFCLKDYVEVVTTDPAHENEEELEFCQRGTYGQIVGDFYNNARFVLVQFIVIKRNDVEIINVGLLCDNLIVV